MRINNLFKLIVAIAVSELAGIIGSFFTVSAIPTWYAGLAKPALNPPAWVFGPVWTILYALMGISLFLIWTYRPAFPDTAMQQKQHPDKLEFMRISQLKGLGIAIFFAQLFLNAAWSIIFFGLQSPGWALVDIATLWLAIVLMMFIFHKISSPASSIWTTAGHGKLAAYLLVPYFLWVSFASYLNYSIWILN